MHYDFTTLPDRRGKDAIAVDMVGQPGGFAPAGPKEGFSLIPMWVADMNFLACPAIQEAVIRRTEHPAFGYFSPSDAYYNSIINTPSFKISDNMSRAWSRSTSATRTASWAGWSPP